MMQALIPLITTIATALVEKHKREGADKIAAVTTQVAAVPALLGSGAIAVTDYSSDVDAIIALVSTLISVGLYCYRKRSGVR